ncbi:MAG: bifunctional 5,10-methylenetetrahydrofolate dehydrogenase/5,10-methenyltetrahydrofolate cyclohydrolase [Bacilli bacterium]|nr:bifunctional 5,10-methylenetetrahydrofolate dehydrogenase/5,10-methenyltetrahydrofolate cyclohydrolase [Bacilli bacterium]
MILDGKKISEEILLEVKNKVYDLHLSLAVIQIGNDQSSNVYINQKKKLCNILNIAFIHHKLDLNISEKEVLKLIDVLNEDQTTGILLQLPIPNHLDTKKIQNRINYKKDVDGLNNINVCNLINNKPGIIPCTAKGIMTLLNKYNIKVAGKNVVVVGRSNIVGKPISNLLLNSDATVTVCHSKTKNLAYFTKNADILIAATGKKHLITNSMVKEGAVIIDVGINKIDNKLYGDVDFEKIKNISSYITPVPGGIGPMTIASLAENLYDAYILQQED